MRSLPSAVTRIRLQSPQNGSVTGEMKPIEPWPSANSQRRDVPWRSRPRSFERIRGVDQPPDLGVGQHAVARPRAVAVQRHELDEADLVRVLAGELGEAHDLVLGEVLQRDDVDLDRPQLGVLLGRREPLEHLLRASCGA